MLRILCVSCMHVVSGSMTHYQPICSYQMDYGVTHGVGYAD